MAFNKFVSLFPLILCFIASFNIINVSGQAINDTLFVKMDAGELGEVIGIQLWTSQTLRPFYIFHGIPYAESTAGDARFKPSVVRDGPLTDDGSPFQALNPLVLCPQGGIFRRGRKLSKVNKSNVTLLDVIKAKGFQWSESLEEESNDAPMAKEENDIDEDEIIIEDEARCLVLNINTPKIPTSPTDKKMPVIFFIHGGSSTQIWGSLFTGFRFLEHDVVLVTINYRLGVLGALNLGIDDAPGNAAMYDCITALKWVQEHIHHWGGDKDSVTVYGHSAGGMMVSHLLLSPLANGLIHGVIGASGSALAAWGTSQQPSINQHLQVAFFAGCYPDESGIPTDDINYSEIYTCMKDKDVEILLRALSSYSDKEQKAGRLGFDAQVPSVQNPNLNTPLFLESSPIDILANKKQNNVPLIMGAMRHDGSFAFEDIYRSFILQDDRVNNATFLRNDLLPIMLDLMKATDKSGTMAHAIGRTYFGEAYKTGDFDKMIPGLIDITSVWGFKAPAYELVAQHSKLNPNSYYYSFDHMGFWSTYDMGGSDDIPGGIAHIDDMMYTFQIFPLFPIDQAVSQRLVTYFVNFAYYGDPNGQSGEIKFPQYNSSTHAFLKIGKEDSIGLNCRDDWIDAALEIV